MAGSNNRRKGGNNGTGALGSGGLTVLGERQGLKTITRKASNDDNMNRSTSPNQNDRNATFATTPHVSSNAKQDATASGHQPTSTNAKQYPPTLSKKRSLPFNPNLPPRPNFDQFSNAQNHSILKTGGMAGSTMTAGRARSLRGDHLEPAGAGRAESGQAVPTPTVTPRKSSNKGRNGGKSKTGGRGNGNGKNSQRTPAKQEDADPESAAPSTSGSKEDMNAPPPTPSPTPGRGRPSGRKQRKPTSPGSTTNGRPTSSGRAKDSTSTSPPLTNSYQSLEDLLSKAGYRETRVFTPEAEKLKRLQREHGDKVVRRVKSALTSTDDGSVVRLGRQAPVDVASYAPASPEPFTTSSDVQDSPVPVSSPPFRHGPTAAAPDPSTLASSAPWWTQLNLPWLNAASGAGASEPPVVASAKHALELALRSTMASLDEPNRAPIDGVRRMRSANDLTTRVTGFEWADEPIQLTRVRVPPLTESATSKPSPARHRSDTALDERDQSAWGSGGGSPIKRKRRVLNRVALEIEVKPIVPVVLAEDVTVKDDEVVLPANTSVELSPSTSTNSDATIKPQRREAPSDEVEHTNGVERGLGFDSTRSTGSDVVPDGETISDEPAFDQLAYEARDSGDFDGYTVPSTASGSLSLSNGGLNDLPSVNSSLSATPPRPTRKTHDDTGATSSPPAPRLPSPTVPSPPSTSKAERVVPAYSRAETSSVKHLKHAASVPALVHRREAAQESAAKSAGWLPVLGIPWPSRSVAKPAASSANLLGRNAASSSDGVKPAMQPRRPLPPRAVTSIADAPRRPASPRVNRGAPIVCDSNQAEDLPPIAASPRAATTASVATDGGAFTFKSLRSVLSLSALRFAKVPAAAEAAPDPSDADSALSPTLSPRLDWGANTGEPVGGGFNALYKQKTTSEFEYTDNIDEVEAFNEAIDSDYLSREPDFTQSFFYQPPTPPRPVDDDGNPIPRRENKRQQSIKSLRAHLLKQNMASKTAVAVTPAKYDIPPVPPIPKDLVATIAASKAAVRAQTIVDRRLPPPVFAISSPGTTDAGLPPRELILEGEEWDAGSFESNRQRELSCVRTLSKKLPKRPSLKRRKSTERR